MPELGYYVAGDWNAQCDGCGRNFKFSSLKKRWDGAYVCEADWEPRHPQDFCRAVRDNPSVPVARPQNIVYLVNSDNIYSEFPLNGETLG